MKYNSDCRVLHLMVLRSEYLMRQYESTPPITVIRWQFDKIS